MNRNLLDLVPKRYLCPYCGEWHEWKQGRAMLGDFDNRSKWDLIQVECTYLKGQEVYNIYFAKNNAGNFMFCGKASKSFCSKLITLPNIVRPISLIKECEDKPIVTITSKICGINYAGKEYCKNCERVNKCNLAKLGDEGDNQHVAITLGFEFDRDEYLLTASTITQLIMRGLIPSVNSNNETLPVITDEISRKNEDTSKLDRKEELKPDNSVNSLSNICMNYLLYNELKKRDE